MVVSRRLGEWILFTIPIVWLIGHLVAYRVVNRRAGMKTKRFLLPLFSYGIVMGAIGTLVGLAAMFQR